jgi:hypothetical protein
VRRTADYALMLTPSDMETEPLGCIVGFSYNWHSRISLREGVCGELEDLSSPRSVHGVNDEEGRALNEPLSIEGLGEGTPCAATAAPTLQAGFYLTALHWPPTGSPTLP